MEMTRPLGHPEDPAIRSPSAPPASVAGRPRTCAPRRALLAVGLVLLAWVEVAAGPSPAAAQEPQVAAEKPDGEEPAEDTAPEELAGVTVTASAADGFSLRSSDGNFVLRFRGYVQADGRFFADEPTPPATDTFLLRRARLNFEGTIHKHFGFRILPDFPNGEAVLQDAYVQWSASDALVLRVGKMKVPSGLERRQSATQTAFMERALPSALLPIRDVGLQLSGELAGGRVDYAAGGFNGGALDGASADSDTNDAKDLAARIRVAPWEGTESPLAGFSLGIGGTFGDQQGTPASPGLPVYRTSGLQTFFSYRADDTAEGTTFADGERLRLVPQVAFFRGPLGLLAEYATSSQEVRRGGATAELEHSAYQVTGVWVLTGENAALRWHSPEAAFDRRADDPAMRGWGAFAVTARYHALHVDEGSFPVFADPDAADATAQQEAEAWAVGFDWTLLTLTRLMLDYEVTRFEPFGGAAAREDEKTLSARLQISW